MTKFTSVQDAFNFYRTKSIAEMEKRATEMKAIIETDPDVDITAMNIELTGLNEAKANATENATGETGEARSMNPITGLNMEMIALKLSRVMCMRQKNIEVHFSSLYLVEN